MKKTKIIVVDDSALMRKIISDIISSKEDMEVIGTARNGQDLLDKLKNLEPDVITLDVEMPVLDGISTLKELKKRQIPIPVIILSSVTQKGTQLTMDCLAAGAFDFIAKPSGAISLDISKVGDELIQKIRIAYHKENNMNNIMPKSASIPNKNGVSTKMQVSTKINDPKEIEVVVIGASTGGPKALYTVVTALPEKLGVPVFIVQHMPVGFTKAFAERLNNNSKIKVVEAQDKESIEKDVVYVAPGGYHMEIGNDKRVHLNQEPAIWGVRPAVDKLFISACKVYGSHILSVILTGMGRDGANGTVEIKKNGGITMSEDESTCTIYGMPRAAYETGSVDIVAPINEISTNIVNILYNKNNRR